MGECRGIDRLEAPIFLRMAGLPLVQVGKRDTCHRASAWIGNSAERASVGDDKVVL